VHHLVRGIGDYPHEKLLDLASESGAKWSRFIVRWPYIEVEKGHYDWDLFDTGVEGLTSRGVNLFVGTSASSHPAYHDFPEGYWYPPTPSPEAMAGYCRYIATMVERYRDRVRHFEIWNEPNIRNFWRPEPDPNAYAYLVREAANAMRDVDPDIKILAGVLAGVGPERLGFVRPFMQEPGTAEAFDIFTYHPYNPIPEETFEQIRTLAEVVHDRAPGKPLWQGECGCPSSGDTIHFRGDAPWGYNVQSKWLLRRLLTDYLAGAEVSIYFLLVEFYRHRVNGDPASPLGYNTKGLIQHTTWEPKPAYYTFQNLAACIDSTWLPVAQPIELEVLDPGTFYGIGPHENRLPCVPWHFAMAKGDTRMLLHWLPWRPQEMVEPAKVRLTAAGVRWSTPVVVDLLTGEVSEAELEGEAVIAPMADYPMIVTERAALDLVDAPQQPNYQEIVAKLRWTY